MMFLRPFLPYLGVAVLTAFIGLGTWTTLVSQENRALRSELQTSQSRYLGCTNRIQDIMEDKQSDASVTDPSIFDPPDRWFLPSPGSTD